jgi:[glutamine synthetase] adenylyltransferase / [glutamine synthetase]-adenylyl-L-tyrosine phosphorylase
MSTAPGSAPSNRESSLAGRLARLGFRDPARAERLLSDHALAGLMDPLEDVFDDGLLAALSSVPQPDQALLGLVRLMEALAQASARDDAVGREHHHADPAHLRALVRTGGPVRDRLMAVLGTSVALGDHLAKHPEDWTALESDVPWTADELRADLVAAVAGDPDEEDPVAAQGVPTYDALRRAYRRRLLAIAGRDLRNADPTAEFPEVARELADLAEAALCAALAIARGEHPEAASACRVAIIGMGKTGGRELNYVSDVDVIFVAEPLPGGAEMAALEAATQLATAAMRACSTSTAEGTLWPVDAALRPEGKAGPLVRTLASHVAYYERWAKTWEFQALLKARPLAGDMALGEAYVEALAPLVWSAAERENFVADVQAMRRRVEEHVPADQAARQLKLGKGGLRDVEFSVQLLQLVHGRTDETLRSRTTLDALAALAAGGYVARDDAASLDAAYRVLRSLEHRVQLHRLRRTHLMPTDEEDLHWLGRSMGHRANPAHSVQGQWHRQAREVRRLHERIFYRPLLAAVARLSPDDARLSPEAARERLSALGFHDPAGAMRHIAALTEGVSRRAAMQRTLLPVMLGWFADEADPDAGLLSFRRVSEKLGGSHWYLKMLRDSGSAAERLAHVLSRSRYAGDLLQRAPEAALVLGDDSGLRARPADALREEVLSAVRRKDDQAQALEGARAVRRRELFRTAVADLVGYSDLEQVGAALTDITSAVIGGALDLATRAVEQRGGQPLAARIVVVGMGRFGGDELGYGSDSDVMFVYDPVDGADEREAQEGAAAVVTELRKLLSAPGPDPAIELDVGLRPEGKNGPLVRSLASYRSYYQRWSLVWEAQALLRATPVAGDPELAKAFEQLIEPVRWPHKGLALADIREVRRIKARVEAERLPKGVDPSRHLKLGRGGLADVEWTVQLLQLQHAHGVPTLRTTGTLPALVAAVEAGLLDPSDGDALAQAWSLASRWRNAAVLWRGRPVEALPVDARDLDGVARIVGYHPGEGQRAEDDYLRVTRRARHIVERVFYA